MTCDGRKKGYTNRLVARHALDLARAKWRRNPERAPEPPREIYRCECGLWHLTHWGEVNGRGK